MKNFDLRTTLPYMVIVLLLLGLLYYNNKSNKLEETLDTEVKFRTALLDSVTFYKNKHNEIVAEKLTLQTSIKELSRMNGRLSADKKELLERVKEANKKNTVIAAALIKTNVKLDSLQKSNVVVSVKDSTIKFTPKDSTYVNYEIMVLHVSAFTNIKPELVFNKMEFKNIQHIDFQWKDNKKEGYPVAFTVSNKNPLFMTESIESYIIPEIRKEEIKPSFWNRLGKGIKGVGTPILYIGVGAGATWLFLK